MRTRHYITGLLLTFLLMLFDAALAQFSKIYEGPDDPAGDQAAVRSAPFNGNRFYVLLNNNTSLWDTGHGYAIWNKWPDIYSGFTMAHGVNMMMAARTYVAGESTIVDNLDEIKARDDLTVIYRGQHGWRGRNDLDPTGTVEWGCKPVITYMNPLAETMALSNNPFSWPPNGWPARGDEKKWAGEWDGRFGRGVIYADLEAYYVVNDAQDQEYLGEEDSVKYYPRPGVRIGDKDPNVTTQKGLPWGGIGLRIAIRAFQWNNPQSRDAIFVEYTTANISDYDLPEMCFGYYLHPYVGEDHGLAGDDYLYFDSTIDLAYNWDRDGVGQGGLPTGAFGMAYLESPANQFDQIDNDDDGLVDEKRDNTAEKLVGPYDGISDLNKFLNFYKLTEEDLHQHWDADEDQDWQDGNDANGNGIYDAHEDPGDDVGLDGVGPGELNYNGPDEGECNHKPDFLEGVGCEPNFAFTDVSESDMLGLTSFHTYDHESEPRIHTDDQRIWEYFSDTSYDEFQDQPGAWVTLFATGIFPLYKGRTERISMSLVASYDPLEGLNSPEHKAPSLYRKKEVTQIIYERDYRFAMPPKMPTLNAHAGDGKVVLTWDDVAEVYTREPLLRNANDFEGYKLYKATDKSLVDAQIITDGYGNRLYRRPVFQCDLVNDIAGFADFGFVDGVAYYLGDDSGIQHYFVDTDVENGKTYYYALVAYDAGIPELGDGVTPSENNIVIELDEAEAVKSYGRNVAIVTPHQTAAGYTPPQIRIDGQSWPPSAGWIAPAILSPGDLKPSHSYRVAFTIDTAKTFHGAPHGLQFTTNGYEVTDLTESRTIFSKIRKDDEMREAPRHSIHIDTLDAYSLTPFEDLQSDAFDGLSLHMRLDTPIAQDGALDYEASGWRVGNQTGDVKMRITPSRYLSDFPWEYEIIYGDPGMYTGQVSNVRRVRDENGNAVNRNLLLGGQSFDFAVVLQTFADSTGAHPLLDLVVFDADTSGAYEPENDKVYVGYVDELGRWYRTLFVIDFEEGSAMPQPNDVYRLVVARPFFISDYLEFTVLPAGGLDRAAVKSVMDSIQVVPNPYVATNRMEEAVANQFLNQRRRLLFTHLPAQCEIHIFTVSGVLVDVIDVDNGADNGTAYWDLLSREGLEVAAGVYIYHVKARETGDEKIGKFSIIK